MFIWKNVVAPADGQATFDRRASNRLKVAISIQACRVTQGKFCRFNVQDISAGGLRFASSVPLGVGEVLDVQLPVGVGSVINIVGKVTWCRSCTDSSLGAYEGGIAFTRISAASHAKLTQYLATLEGNVPA